MRWRSVSVVVAAAMVVLVGALMVPNRASAAWQAQPSGTSLELLAVAFGDPAHGWVTTRVDGSSRNHILATGDGGGRWHRQSYAGYREALWDVAFADASHGWAVGSWNASEAEGGTIVGTSDGGKHWRKLYSPTGSEYGSGYVYGVACAGRSRVWAVGCNMIVATVNGGATWRVQRRWRSSSGANNVLWDICFTDRSCGWTVGNRGHILATTNGGARWRAQLSGTTFALFGVTFADRTHGWAVGDRGTIVATTDGGASWHRQDSGTQERLVGVASASPSIGWAVGEAGTILATTDGGATWNTSYSAPVGLSAVTCVDGREVVVVGGQGTILSSPVQ